MAVALAYGSETTTELIKKAKEVATKTKWVNFSPPNPHVFL